MPTRNVELTEHLDSLIETGINSGRFTDASEVVREGLRLLEQKQAEDQAKLEWLRNTAQEAFASLDRGEGIELSSADDIDNLLKSLNHELLVKRTAMHCQT